MFYNITTQKKNLQIKCSRNIKYNSVLKTCNLLYKISLIITLYLVKLGATTYYVSLSGDDGWSGTSPDSAWRHIEYAASVVVAGDSILVDSGSYTDEHVVFANSGFSGNPIVLTAYNDTFILDGIDSTGIAIKISDKSYISISGFHIKNYGIGIYGEDLLQNLFISNFIIEDIDGPGLNFNSGSLQNSTITDFIIRNTSARAISHYDFGSTDCHDVEIANFLIRDIDNEGILWENTKRVHIHHGEICNTASDGIHLYKNLDSSLVEYVHIDTTGWHGIAIHDPYMNRPCSCNVIRNCYVRGASHGSIDLHSGAFNTIVEGCSLIGPPYTVGIYFHNRGAGLLAQNNYVKNMHWGLFCGHTNEGHFIKDVVFKNNIVENTERYGGCAWRDTGNRILSNVRFIDNTFIHCSQQSGYHNLVLVRVDTAQVEGNSFIESLIPDEPHIRLGEVSEGLVLNLGDNFTRIQVYDTDARLEFSDGKAFTEDGSNQPFWFPDHSEYLLNLDETIEINTFTMTLSPTSDSVELVILQWDTTGTYYKNWQEISENPSVITSHTIDNFPAYAQVEVLVNSVPYDTFVTDSTGWFSFDYTGGFVQDTVTFETIYLTGIEDERKSGQIPVSFSLNQNYPNPFKSITEIRYNLARESVVELSVFNILGEKMKTLVKENQHPGCYTIHWDGCDQRGNKMANGVYFYQLRVGNHAIRRKAIIRR